MDTIIINDKFAYTQESVIIKGVSYPLTTIKEIGFSTFSMKINFVPTGTNYYFTLILDNDDKVELNNSLGLFTKKMVNKLSHAYAYLKKVSFNSRYNKYIDIMNSQGYFEYSSGFSKYHFYPNGDIVKGNKRINIKKAQKDGFIWFGTERGVPGAHYYSTNPTQVTISESKRKYFNSNKLSIDFTTNSDVLFSIIKKISNE